MKKVLTLVCALALTLGFSLSAFASPQRLVDEANLLTDAQKSEVRNELDSISADLGIDVVVVTVKSLNGKTATAFADDYFDYNGYGMGSDKDGCLLLICPEERDYAISTHGICEKKFTTTALNDIVDVMHLSNEDFHYSFMTYASEVKYLYEDVMANGGRGPFGLARKLGVSLVIGLIVGLITLVSLKSQLKSVVRQSGASSYTKEGSFHLTENRDYFLYSQTTRTEIPKNDSNNTGSHTSSSGQSHGGVSGKY